MTFTIIVLVSFATFAGFVRATDYCSTSICSEGVKHIACGNTGNFISSCPADASLVNIDNSLKAALVNGHNQIRNFIAGGGNAKHNPACRMATMQWDDELASLAALNVMQCKMAHDNCRNTDAFKYAGQNLAWMGYSGSPNDMNMLARAVQMWYDEVQYSNSTFIASYPSNYQGPTIGHFTVMVADRNIRLGCAASTYSVSGASYKAYLVACNYATTNMLNFPIYASCSTAGSSCSSGKNSAYSNLCSTSEVYAVNKWF